MSENPPVCCLCYFTRKLVAIVCFPGCPPSNDHYCRDGIFLGGAFSKRPKISQCWFHITKMKSCLTHEISWYPSLIVNHNFMGNPKWRWYTCHVKSGIQIPLMHNVKNIVFLHAGKAGVSINNGTKYIQNAYKISLSLLTSFINVCIQLYTNIQYIQSSDQSGSQSGSPVGISGAQARLGRYRNCFTRSLVEEIGSW